MRALRQLGDHRAPNATVDAPAHLQLRLVGDELDIEHCAALRRNRLSRPNARNKPRGPHGLTTERLDRHLGGGHHVKR
jgi:hypothetical protein